MSVLAFIPARGYFKGIPRKNLVPLAGKPLIQYTLEAAKNSKMISEIFLYCKSYGIEVSYRRPSYIARDTTSMVETVIHAFN